MPAPAIIEEKEIQGLTADSRRVQPDYLFAALPGTQVDGRKFIRQAVEKGAVAILAPSGTKLDQGIKAHDGTAPVLLADPNPRRRLALLAAQFYCSQPATIAAVTGTNGKTSTALFTQQIWQLLNHKAVSLGTIGLHPNHQAAPASLTTPDAVELHACLAALAEDGFDHLVMEASSHGLDQHRLDGVQVRAAAFTNLSRDHLDYHQTTEAYRNAKQRLFRDLLATDGTAVLNLDSPESQALIEICQSRGIKTIGYGKNSSANLRLVDQRPNGTGQDVTLEVMGIKCDIALPLAGDFQAWNVLAALGIVIACGADPTAALLCLPRLKGIPGRAEYVGDGPGGGAIYVDYSHTPDALETILKAMRPHTVGELWVIVGCGGDRDRGKRPMMGEIAVRLADRVIVTDDNPRSEDPAAIRAQIMAAAPTAQEIGDRGAAIMQGVAALRPGDVLIIAGKGHETGQTIGGKVLPFDDRSVARDAAGIPTTSGQKPNEAGEQP